MVGGVGIAPTSRSPNDMLICCCNDPLEFYMTTDHEGRGTAVSPKTIISHFDSHYNYVAVSYIGAGEGNRTLVFCLEGSGSTIELHPQLSYC